MSGPHGEVVRVEVGATFTLRLPAIPAAGFDWREEHDAGALELVGDRVGAPADAAPGASAEHVFAFRAKRPGPTEVVLRYGRPWEAEPREERRVRVAVQAPPAPPGSPRPHPG